MKGHTWRDLIESMLRERDGHTCDMCGELMEYGDTHIHHERPEHTLDALRLLHAACHRLVHSNPNKRVPVKRRQVDPQLLEDVAVLAIALRSLRAEYVDVLSDARKGGATLQQIADVAGVKRQAVWKLLKRWAPN